MSLVVNASVDKILENFNDFENLIIECQSGVWPRIIGSKNKYCTTYQEALNEMKAGKKTSHWIWYIFPSMIGVRKTNLPQLMLPKFQFACSYLKNEILISRLVEITQVVSQKLKDGVDPAVLFGKQASYDAPKFHEVMTCFWMASKHEHMAELELIFKAGIDATGKQPHQASIELINKEINAVK